MKRVLSVVVALALMAGVSYAGLNQAPGARLTSNSSVQKEDLGAVADFDDLRARYVRFGSAVGDGTPVVAENAIWGVVQAGSLDSRGLAVIGFSVAAIDSGNFGWIAVSGISDIQADTNTVVIGSGVICGAGTDVGGCSAIAGDTGAVRVGTFLVTDPDSSSLKNILIQGIY